MKYPLTTITNIPYDTKILIVVGPNGSGKSSLFDAFHRWYANQKADNYSGRDDLYYIKNKKEKFDYNKAVTIKFHDFVVPENLDERYKAIDGKFYFRSAYRNQADFTVSTLKKQSDPRIKLNISNLIQNDAAVEDNYQRLVSLTLKGVYDTANDHKQVKDLRDDLIGRIRTSLRNIFEDLSLSSIGDPLYNGTFYFEKGSSKDYHYKNLSGGEKAAFDIILDLIIKSTYFEDAIYCIDEPETHMHTQLQVDLFTEIYNLLPSTSQLWVNTHSLGILKRAKEIEKANPGTIAFISFDNLNFDEPVVLSPSKIDKAIWEKFIKLTIDDFSDFIVPEKIILCEGDTNGRKNKNFDADIYTRIFAKKYPDVIFISLGSSNDFRK